ncbi:hypothetical protein D3C72_1975860 [compost metagenome]
MCQGRARLPQRRGALLGRAGGDARLAAAGGQCGAERGVLPGRINEAQLLQAMNFLFNLGMQRIWRIFAESLATLEYTLCQQRDMGGAAPNLVAPRV